jgi:hypothetical protein
MDVIKKLPAEKAWWNCLYNPFRQGNQLPGLINSPVSNREIHNNSAASFSNGFRIWTANLSVLLTYPAMVTAGEMKNNPLIFFLRKIWYNWSRSFSHHTNLPCFTNFFARGN